MNSQATNHIRSTPTTCSGCGSDSCTVVATGRDYIYHGSEDFFRYVRCDGCGHFYLNPRPDISQLSLMYPANYGTFSNRFQSRANLLGRVKTIVNRKRLKDVVAHLPLRGRVLDVGCGNGELLIALRQARPDLELFGLDWHFPAETRTALEKQGIKVVEAPLEAAELPAQPFDLIVMLQLIEHLWEPEESLRRLVLALAKDGRLLIETPNTDGWDRQLFAGCAWGGYYFPRHLNLYNFERLAELLRRVGLAVESQRNLPAPLIWIYSLQGAVQARFGWKSTLTKIFGVKNIPLIAAFAFLDIAAIAMRFTTSNQQAISRKA
ncbi:MULTISPECIES: class I SAM-dependent methyltransferase [unclassified Rhizobium]|uniref:class I SAM-dependent methyltransferase n=2 Tax=Rhizobium TaxID=379 RepID=UPI001A98D276|nr:MULTISPECIES: class I SAM-dependent methyltransferase [unclassified Rhizobium]MBX5208906.1 class I SAM-dependent methyltransferase [Rhizobium sp. NZLR11]MBX5157044.1 class I SAM-dependent methyltransferase [Rhizobium sp. NZLR8]MBX5165196.1 class I SAM-dependent methyltransferase [Rhizobium sp. NZLR4b]MBX5172776.1 class I SAM-dependent methyltransferase [Rhizobium sp. NZLR1b]MBX5205630.1 class I SAM-dependent methyltransferase [Rhizobium sp. NZLR1]